MVRINALSPYLYTPTCFNTQNKAKSNLRLNKTNTQKVFTTPVFCANLGNIVVNNLIQQAQKEGLEDNKLVQLFLNKILKPQEITNICSIIPDKIPKHDVRYFATHKIPLTHYDDAKIITIRQKEMQKTQLTKTDSEFLEHSKEILAKETEKIKNAKPDGKFVIVSGLPGAGKSTYIDNTPKFKDYYLADIDILKEYFPKYRKDKSINIYHTVVRDVMQNTLIPYAIKQGRNVVIPTTGLGEYYQRLAIPAKQANFTTELHYLPLNMSEAVRRTMKRFRETQRFSDPFFIAIRNAEYKKESPYFETYDYLDIVKRIKQ